MAYVFNFFQHPDGHVSGSRTDLQDCVCGSEGCLVNQALDDEWVFQNVLAQTLKFRTQNTVPTFILSQDYVEMSQ